MAEPATKVSAARSGKLSNIWSHAAVDLEAKGVIAGPSMLGAPEPFPECWG